jgi:nicotinamide-nucleotide adenylyltransferase
MERFEALYIGRFQPFHRGHLGVIKRLITDFDFVNIGIGSAQYSHIEDNPFTLEERKRMISKTLDQEKTDNYKIFGIKDLHDYPKWVDYVMDLVPNFDVVFTNDELCHELFRKKGKKVEGIELTNPNEYSATVIRRRMANDEPWEELVPQTVKEIIEEIGGVSRIKELHLK